jgi:hypothetical protein
MAKIKSDELMIGNYVSVKQEAFEDLLDCLDLEENDIIPDRNCIEVCEIAKHGLRLFIFDEQEFDYKDIEPIPLTEQWLKDLGFRIAKDENDWFSIKTEVSFTNLEINLEEKRCILFNRNKIEFNDILYPRYVHQLQNLFWCLTGKKLTK